LVLVGPSGSGKTTALRMLAGLESVDYGWIWIGGRDVSDLQPKQRDVAMAFQNYALYPYLSVAANIAFPLRIAGLPKSERERRVRDVAALLGFERYLERGPGQLSGGQRNVTHDQSEAMTLGDRVAVLGDGRLQQCATPRELYERPTNTFVAGFIGSPA